MKTIFSFRFFSQGLRRLSLPIAILIFSQSAFAQYELDVDNQTNCDYKIVGIRYDDGTCNVVTYQLPSPFIWATNNSLTTTNVGPGSPYHVFQAAIIEPSASVGIDFADCTWGCPPPCLYSVSTTDICGGNRVFMTFTSATPASNARITITY